jgi:hypothetical protein
MNKMAIQQEVPGIDTYMVDARPEQSTSSAVLSGWEAAEKLTPATGDFPVEFKHSEEPQVVKFVDPSGPFASYRQHFLTDKAGRKSYVCLGADCPLCLKLRHRPEDKRAFTVANLSVTPVQKQMIIASPRLFKTLHMINSTPQGPITKNYWAISRSGVKQSTIYHVVAIKERDLAEDYGIDLTTAANAVAAIEPFSNSTIKQTSYSDLLAIAEELLDR